MSKQVQFRGHCQCCGRQQAVPNGRMSNHGYVVRDGWFQGVCDGHRFEPMEQDRKVADEIVAQVRRGAAALEVEAADLESGKVAPSEIKDPHGYMKNEPKMIPWVEAPEWMQRDAVKSLVFGKRRRAKIGYDFANMLEKIANDRNGKPLIEAVKPEPTARIEKGEKRVNEGGRVLIAEYQDGARVYWKDARGYGAWMGSKRWRSLAKVEG